MQQPLPITARGWAYFVFPFTQSCCNFVVFQLGVTECPVAKHIPFPIYLLGDRNLGSHGITLCFWSRSFAVFLVSDFMYLWDLDTVFRVQALRERKPRQCNIQAFYHSPHALSSLSASTPGKFSTVSDITLYA